MSQGTRPDLSYSALQLAKKNNSATIADLRNVNKIVEKIKKEENKVVYSKVGEKEKLQLIGIVDASYKSDEKSVGGMLLMIADEQMTKASLVMWKSKQIDRVCHSSKDAETLALSKLLDEAAYLARQIEMLLFGDYKQRIPVRIYTDSEPSLESIASPSTNLSFISCTVILNLFLSICFVDKILSKVGSLSVDILTEIPCL